MNFEPVYGWFYLSPDNRTASWTGVEYLWNYLTRKNGTVGPIGTPCEIHQLYPGDLIQLSFTGEKFQHSPIVVAVRFPIVPENILVAAHSFDADNRPLSTYEYRDIRMLHITGTIRP